MKSLFSFLVFIFNVGLALGQEENKNVFDTTAFINSMIKDKRHHIYLYTDVNGYTISQLERQINKAKFVRRIEDENGKAISDSIVLDAQEQQQLLLQLKALVTFRWKEETVKGLALAELSLLSRDTVSNNFEYSIKYEIVPPLLLKAGAYCLFSYEYHCGPLCGHGHTAVYKKDNDKWKYWWTLMLWDE